MASLCALSNLSILSEVSLLIELGKKTGSVNLTQQMMKGDPGGYYKPEVNEEGLLSWTATGEGMEPAETANIKGPQGEPGESGVYVGTEEPGEGIFVWVNPQGEGSNNLATKEYVDEAIAAIGGGGTVDLSNYYTKEETEALIPDTSGFTTMTAVEEKGYQTEAQVNSLINTALGVIENGNY